MSPVRLFGSGSAGVRLGELEQAVMDVLWSRTEPATVREVAAALAERNLAYTTVMTVLDRLARKQIVLRQRDGRAWRYRAAATRDAFIAELMLQALELTGDRDAALVRFARSVSDPEAEVLRAALDSEAVEYGIEPPRTASDRSAEPPP